MAEPVRRSGAPRHNQIEAIFRSTMKEEDNHNTRPNNFNTSYDDQPERYRDKPYQQEMAFYKSERTNEPFSAREMPSEADIKAARFELTIEDSGMKRARSISFQELKIGEKPVEQQPEKKKNSLILPKKKRQHQSLTLREPSVSASSGESKMFDDAHVVKKRTTLDKLPTRSKSMMNRTKTRAKTIEKTERSKIEAILKIAFQGKGSKFHEEQQLSRHISVMEEVIKNIEVEEGIFVFRSQASCGFQIPVDETEYVQRNKSLEQKDEKRLNQVHSGPDSEKEQEGKKPVQQDNWEHTQKIVVYDGRSLYLFDHSSTFRRIIVALTEDKKFDNFILLLIISNSICLLLYEYKDRDNVCLHNQYLEKSMRIFTWFFISEAVLKIIAQGFIKHKNSYLRDPWNLLDCTVVIFALIEMIFGGQNFKGLRTLRVFRPLRSINQFPAMKKLIRSLGASAGPLMQAVFFLTVVFILFSILGVKQLQGSFYQRCRTTSDKVLNAQNIWIWPYDKAIDRLCSKNSRGFTCPDGMICGTPLDVGLSLQSDNPEEQKLINYGITTFDNLLFGFITIFQMITREGWTTLMYDLVDSGQPFFARIFCVSIIFTCSFFLLNVFLAVLAESIDEAQAEDPYEIKRRDEISKSLLRARTQKRKTFKKTDSLQSFLEQEEQISQITVSKIVENKTIQIDNNPSQVESSHSEILDSKRDQIKQKSDSRNINNFMKNINNTILPNSAQIKAQDLSQLNQDNTVPPGNTSSFIAEAHHTVQSQVPSTQVKFVTTMPSQNEDNAEDEDSEHKLNMHQLKESILKKKRLSYGMPMHVVDNRLFQLCYAIARSSLFNFTFILITIINTVSLASYYKGISTDEVHRLDVMERIFRWLFLTEMTIKLLGLGFKQYIRDGFNGLEALLVVFSMVEEVIEFTFQDSGDLHAGALTSFRALRLLRIFRLARSWKTLHALVNMMEKSIKDVSTFSVLLLIMMTIFLLLGRELFSHLIKFSDKQLIKPLQARNESNLDGFVPRWNFDEPDIGFITIFLVIVGDDWNFIMYDFYRVLYHQDYGKAYFSVIYFVLLYVIGNIVLLNLFLAILLANFDSNKNEQDDYLDDSEIENQANSCVKFWLWVRFKVAACCPKYFVAPPIADQITTSSSSFSDEEDSESEKQESNSKSQQSRDDTYNKIFGLDQNKPKPELNQFEMKMLKIRAENQQKSKLKSEMMGGSQHIIKRTRAVNSLVSSNPSSFEVGSTFKTEQQIALKIKQPELEGGSSEGEALEFQQERSKRHSSLPSQSQSNSEKLGSQSSKLSSKRHSMSEKRQSLPSKRHSQSQESKDNRSSSKAQSSKSSNKKKPGKTLEARQERLEQRAAKRKESIRKRRSTVVLALIQQHKIKAMKRRNEDAARLEKLKNAKRTSIAIIKMQENQLGKSVLSLQEANEISGTSLSFFDNKSKFRSFLNTIVQSDLFSNAVLVSIMISTLILILENPSYDPHSTFMLTLEILNNLMTLVFILEAVIKIIVYGFILNGETSYLRNIWNVMDFIIVVTSFLGFFEFAGHTQFIKIMRMLRVLRPLSMVGRNQGMRTVIQSLGQAIPEIANLLLVTVMILILFSILGTIIFQGLFHYCHTENISAVYEVQTKWECLDSGGEWVNHDANFDDVFSGLLTMFEIITTEGWINIMWSGVDATSFDVVPKVNNHVSAGIFFICAMIIGGLFLLNLFVGVVINNFNMEKEKLQRNYLLTPLQIEYCDTMAICYAMKPIAEYVSKGNTFKDYLYYVTISPVFENTISISIVLNTMIMACSWYDEPQQMSTAMERVNVAFSIVFTVEAFIKITVQESEYFKDGWSLFDFIIVVISWLDFAFGIYMGHDQTSSAISLFRAFRVARLLRMIKRFPQLRKIFNTFTKSLRQLYNVASLLLLLLVLYSVLGVSFFHSVMLNGSLNEHANFQSFGIAMQTLFRMTTGEAWNELMHGAGRQRSILFQCHEVHLQEWIEHDANGCGNPVAKAYFVSFMLIVSIIFLNMFIAIILEGFSASQQEEAARIKEDAFEAFVNCWQNYDSEATGFIQIDDLELLITDLIQAELKKRTGTNHRQDIMFNLHRDPKLLLFVKMQNNHDSEDDKLMEDLLRDTHLQRAVIRYMNNFVGSLHVPTYQKMSLYQFHDTLATFIKYVFTVQHQEQFKTRSDRIERQKQTGVYLYKWDKMQEKSLGFYKMSITDQEIFLEVSNPDFDEVVDRLEGKSQTKEERIQRVNRMRHLRKQAAREHAMSLDSWEGNVMESSLVIGGRRIIKFVQEWKERRRKKMVLQQISDDSSENINSQAIQINSLESSREQVDAHNMDSQSNMEKKRNLQIINISSPNMVKSLSVEEEEKKESSDQSQDLEIHDFDSKEQQQTTNIEISNNQIVVEETIIEKKRYIISNTNIQVKLSPKQKNMQLLNPSLPRTHSDILSRKLILEENYKDDGSGGVRVETPRLHVRRNTLVLKLDSLEVESGGDGDGSGSKGRSIKTKENLRKK